MDTKNCFDDYCINSFVSILWLIPIGTVYYLPPKNVVQIIAILLAILFLYWFTIHSTIKVAHGTATVIDLKHVTLFPILGLLKYRWTPYRRMARKLVNNEAIRECENALESMSYTGGNPNPFKDGWKHFKEWFPKIEVSDETSEQRLKLINDALSTVRDHEETELLNEFREIGRGIAAAFLLANVSIENSLRKEMEAIAIHTPYDISPEAFSTELEKRTTEFVELQKWLHENGGNSISVFGDLCAIIKEHCHYC